MSLKVKLDLTRQPTDHEIIQFVWISFKATIGRGQLEQFGPVQTTTTDREGVEKEAASNKVNQLPDKMDK